MQINGLDGIAELHVIQQQLRAPTPNASSTYALAATTDAIDFPSAAKGSRT
jgi:hypothetical protein